MCPLFIKVLVQFSTSQRIYLHSPKVQVPHRTTVAPVYYSVGSVYQGVDLIPHIPKDLSTFTISAGPTQDHCGPVFFKLLVRFSTSQRIYLHSPEVQVPHRTIVVPVYHSVSSILHIPEDLSTLTISPGPTQDHCGPGISVLVRFSTCQRIYLHSSEVQVPHRATVPPVYQCWFCLSRCWFNSPHPKGSVYTFTRSPGPTQGHCAPGISQCWYNSPHPKGSVYTHQKTRSHTGPLCPWNISADSVYQSVGSILHPLNGSVYTHQKSRSHTGPLWPQYITLLVRFFTLTRSPSPTQGHCAPSISVLVLFIKVLVRFSTSQRIYLHSPEVQVPHRAAVAPVYHSVGSLLHIPQACSGVS